MDNISNRKILKTAMFFFLMSALVLPVFSQNERPDAYQLYLDGKYEESISVCKAEIAEQSDVVSYYVMGWSLMALHRYNDAIKEMKVALTRHGKHRKVIHILAEAYYNIGEYEEAETYLGDYIKIAPDGEAIGEVYYYLGEIFLRLKEYQHADIAFTTAVYHEKTRSEWWTRLGYCRQQAKEYQYAILAYKEAIRLNPGDTSAIKGLKECEALLGA